MCFRLEIQFSKNHKKTMITLTSIHIYPRFNTIMFSFFWCIGSVRPGGKLYQGKAGLINLLGYREMDAFFLSYTQVVSVLDF